MERNEREANNAMSPQVIHLHRTTPVVPPYVEGPYTKLERTSWLRIGFLILLASAGLVLAIFWSIFK